MARTLQDYEPISVLIAAKNAQDTISFCIRSALIGLRAKDEVLIFLDGCTDNTHRLVAAITDPRIQVFSSKAGVGRSSARNFLIENSKSPLIAILDADDFALPWRFAFSRRLLRRNDAVFGSAFLFGSLPYGLPLALTYPAKILPRLVPQILQTRNPFVHSTAAYRRSALEDSSAYEEVIAEDYALWLRMAIQGKTLRRSRLPIGGYRLSPVQLSAAANYQQQVNECTVLRSRKLTLKEQQGVKRVRRTFGLVFEEEFLKSLRRFVARISRDHQI
ncbi:glycosyltransferase [Aquiluna sp.]|nr:glycosyltransferase [Aquiluna sp.]